eukprot:jgi/Psemu1/49968/gm1.49968_g
MPTVSQKALDICIFQPPMCKDMRKCYFTTPPYWHPPLFSVRMTSMAPHHQSENNSVTDVTQTNQNAGVQSGPTPWDLHPLFATDFQKHGSTGCTPFYPACSISGKVQAPLIAKPLGIARRILNLHIHPLMMWTRSEEAAVTAEKKGKNTTKPHLIGHQAGSNPDPQIKSDPNQSNPIPELKPIHS